MCMQSEGSSYKVTIFLNSEKSIGLHPLRSGIRNERVKWAANEPYFATNAVHSSPAVAGGKVCDSCQVCTCETLYLVAVGR